jgi:hypothetical protein
VKQLHFIKSGAIQMAFAGPWRCEIWEQDGLWRGRAVHRFKKNEIIDGGTFVTKAEAIDFCARTVEPVGRARA